jgi:carbonic anhydrase
MTVAKNATPIPSLGPRLAKKVRDVADRDGITVSPSFRCNHSLDEKLWVPMGISGGGGGKAESSNGKALCFSMVSWFRRLFLAQIAAFLLCLSAERNKMKPRISVLLSLYASLMFLGLPGSAQQVSADAKHELTSHGDEKSADQIWAELMAGNQRFVAGKTKARDLPGLRIALAKGQRPRAVVLACSDSRVGPELLFDQSLGDLFVVRSAGNVADAIGVGSIEYAVEHLGSRLLVVLGHTQCGAVTAACSGEKMPTPSLQAIVDKINPAVSKVQSTPKDALVEAAIKENVRQSARDLLASSTVLQHFVQEGKLSVIEAEYQLETGKVIRLEARGP